MSEIRVRPLSALLLGTVAFGLTTIGCANSEQSVASASKPTTTEDGLLITLPSDAEGYLKRINFGSWLNDITTTARLESCAPVGCVGTVVDGPLNNRQLPLSDYGQGGNIYDEYQEGEQLKWDYEVVVVKPASVPLEVLSRWAMRPRRLSESPEQARGFSAITHLKRLFIEKTQAPAPNTAPKYHLGSNLRSFNLGQ